MSKEKQIEEMAKALNEATFGVNTHTLADHLKPETINKVAEYLYNAGYRKQIEGEWKFEFTLDGDDFYKCSLCGRQVVINSLCAERNPAKHCPYCHCGAKMKGANNE